MKLLVLGASSGSTDIVNYARSIGVYTVVTDYYPVERSRLKQLADDHWEISTNDIDQLEKKCRENKIDAIICGCSEFNTEQLLSLGEKLGLPVYCDRKAWLYSRDKAAFKSVCKEMGLRVPKDYSLSVCPSREELEGIDFPVVVKPVDMSSNRGISFCDNESQLFDGIQLASSLTKSPKMIIEQKINGEEWYAFYALADGESRFIALNAMFSEPGEPSFCYSITTTATDHVKKYLKEMNEPVKDLLKKIGCKEGVAWVQVMLNESDNNFYVIEMGYRLDGDMMFVPYKDLMGFNPVKWLVDYSIQGFNSPLDLPIEPEGPYESCACAYMVWTNQTARIGSIEGLEEISNIEGIEVSWHAEVGDYTEKYRPLGNILFCSKDVNEMCAMINQINGLLAITDDEGNEMIIKFTDFETLKVAYAKGFIEEA